MNIMKREMELQRVFKTEYTRNKWRKVLPVLGILPDKKIAKRVGVTIPCVASVRSKMGIAPVSFPKLCKRYGAEFEAYSYAI